MKVQPENFVPNGSLKYNFQRICYDYPLHIHQFAEIGYVIRGEITVIADQQTYHASEGDFVFLFPMQLHQYSTPTETDYLVSAFSGTLIGDFLSAYEGKRGTTPVFRTSESVRRYFHETFVDGELDDGRGIGGASGVTYETHIVDYTNSDKLFRIKSCLYAILGEYCRTTEMVEMRGDPHAFAKVMRYLADQYREPVSLTDAAQAVGYSAGYLSHIIQKTCGMNFATILGSLRIEYAQYLMRENYDGTMLDLALACGFGTERSFHRMFKRFTGMTPGEFMRTEKRQ